MKNNKLIIRIGIAFFVFSSILLLIVLILSNVNEKLLASEGKGLFYKEKIPPLEAQIEEFVIVREHPLLTIEANKDTGIIEVPNIYQNDIEYYTGCEIVSAVMVLNYYGYDVTVDNVFENMVYSELIMKNGKLYGDNPKEIFIGNPKLMSGYGCYAPVVVEMMNKVFKQELYAVNLTGTKFQQLIEDYIDKGTPVIVWATSNMCEPTEGTKWTINNTNEDFTWISGEHCLVLVGYDDKYYYFNDPYKNDKIIGYERSVVEERYEQLGKQAVVVSK